MMSHYYLKDDLPCRDWRKLDLRDVCDAVEVGGGDDECVAGVGARVDEVGPVHVVDVVAVQLEGAAGLIVPTV